MRCAAVVLVLIVILPSMLPKGQGGTAAPAPLTLFGGDAGTRGASAPLLVVEAYYNALRADEYVAIANVAGVPLNLTGWAITDGEGTLTFPAGTVAAPDAHLVVAQNSTAYAEDTMRAADFRYAAGNATAMAVAGSFQLNNRGDEVLLRDPSGGIVDAFIFGGSPYVGVGWSGPAAQPVGAGLVARRDAEGGWRDTNASSDWDLVRVWSLGQSDFPSESFAFNGTATAFLSPDDAFAPLAALIANATSSIDLEVYTFTSAPVGALLRESVARGVRVRILLEGGPVGGIDSDEWTIARALAAAGAEVRFLVNNTTLDIQERYRYVHAKFAIFDAQTVLVSSENWGPSGFPLDRARGERGWSLAVVHAPLAAHFERVFEDDRDARRRDVFDVAEITGRPTSPKPPPTGIRLPGLAPRTVTGTFRVTPVIGPDTSLAATTILGAIRNASESIDVELFYAHPDWGAFPNPYLEALLAAARRGVSVRLLLDGSPANTDDADPSNNLVTIADVRRIAAAERLPVQAKLVNLGAHGWTRVHTKGMIVDGRTVLVSSINWNRNSATANREAGLLVENADVAAYFAESFAGDWKDDVTPPRADAGPDREVDEGSPVTFGGLGATDDVAVTNWSWDFDGDGDDDAWGPEVAHTYRQEGTLVVRLRVSDAWNNTATDSAIVTVRPPTPSSDFSWASLAVVVVVPILLWFAFKRNRQRINKPP